MTALLLEGRAKAQCQSGGDFAVCPAGDRIYVNTDKKLGALRLSDGGVLWQIDLPTREDSYLAGAATLSTVVVWAGFPGTGIYAFDAKSGKPLWHIDTSSYGVISVGRYFVFSDAEHWEALTAVGERTGKRIWHHSGSRPTRGGVGLLVPDDDGILTELFAIDSHSGQVLRRWPRTWTVSSAAFGDNFAVIGTRSAGTQPTKLALYSTPAYELRWAHDDPQRREFNGVVVEKDRILAAIYPRGADSLSPGSVELDLFQASSGEVVWTKTVKSSALAFSGVALSQDIAVFTTAESANLRTVEGFDAANGQLKWMVRTDHRIDGVTCAGATCYLGGEVGEVLAIDVQTGAQRWYRIPTQ